MIELAQQQTQDPYQVLCDQLQNATGWPVEFVRLRDELVQEVESALLERGEYCWWQRIDNGLRCVGLLIVNMPDQQLGNGSYESIIALGKSIATLMCRHAQSERLLAEQVQGIRAFSNLGNRPRAEPSLGENLRELLSAAARLTGYQSACFYLLNPGTTRLKLRLAHGMTAHELPAAHRELKSSWPDLDALSQGFSFVERKSVADDQCLPREAATGLVVPVQSATIPLGTLWVFDAHERQFQPRDLDGLQAVAGHLALLLERRMLLHDSEAQQRVQTELRLVSEHLNRASRPGLPPTCSVDATYRCQSRYEISGDLCELLVLSETSIAIAVGDASGNSIPAALVATAVKGALKSMSGPQGTQDSNPTVVMGRLNRALDTIAGDHQFMSLFYAVYDAPTRMLTYCSAGHPAAILLRNGNVSMLQADGFLLGILDDVEFDSTELQLQVDDLLIVYTDGISETHGPEDRLFGEVGIVNAIQRAASESIEGILDAIWKQAEAFAGPQFQMKSDDRSLLVLRVL